MSPWPWSIQQKLLGRYFEIVILRIIYIEGVCSFKSIQQPNLLLHFFIDRSDNDRFHRNYPTFKAQCYRLEMIRNIFFSPSHEKNSGPKCFFLRRTDFFKIETSNSICILIIDSLLLRSKSNQ